MSRSSILFVSVLAACGQSQQEATAERSPEPAPESSMAAATPPPSEAPSAPAGPSVSDESFTLEARASQPSYQSGALSQFGIHLAGRGEWHVNQDFPFSIELEAPGGVGLVKRELGRADAAEFADEGCRVDVPFTPSEAGEHEVRARVSFAMCNPASCVPKTETVALRLAVTPQS